MSKEIEINYTFDYVAKKVTLLDRESIESSKLYAIINVTRGVIYYTVGAADKVVTISGNEITLNAGIDTTGHSNSDVLFILYESTEMLEVLQAIRRGINTLCNTIGVATPDTSGRLRVNAEVAGTLTTLTTLSNMANIGGWSANQVVGSIINNTSANSFRSNIVVTD